MAAGDPLARLRARLDRDCLQHLREHCAEQAQRIDELERELRYTQDVCDQWRDEAEALREHVIDAVGELLADNESAFVPAPWDDLDPSLMTAGQLLVVALSGHHSAARCAEELRERIAALPTVQECIQERAAELLEQQQ